MERLGRRSGLRRANEGWKGQPAGSDGRLSSSSSSSSREELRSLLVTAAEKEPESPRKCQGRSRLAAPPRILPAHAHTPPEGYRADRALTGLFTQSKSHKMNTFITRAQERLHGMRWETSIKLPGLVFNVQLSSFIAPVALFLDRFITWFWSL